MKKLFANAALLAQATPAGATETTFFTDSRGRSLGSADRFGDITYYNHAQGRTLGSSTRLGNQNFMTTTRAVRSDRRPPLAAMNERRRAPAAPATPVTGVGN